MGDFNPLAQEPARVLLAGDWHGNTDWARRTIEFAVQHNCQAVIQLGDFGIWPGPSGRRYLDVLQRWLHSAGIWCAFIDGNHEDFWQLNALPLDEHGLRPVRPGIWHIPRGTRWQWAGRTWLGLGGATSLDRADRRLGRDWWPEEAITAAQGEQVMAGGHADVMLTHDCPAGVPMPGLEQSGWSLNGLAEAHAHARGLLNIVEVVRPHQLWHGHYHLRYRADVQFAGRPCMVNGLGYDGSARLLESVAVLDV